MGDVEVRTAHLRELGLVRRRIEGGIAQDADDRDEELRADDVHLLVLPGDVDDAGVVELALGLERGDEHGVLAALLAAVRIELFEVRVVGLVARGVLLLGLHLEHDRDDLGAVLVALAEDVVALGGTVVLPLAHGDGVLGELGARERRGADAVELDLAMLLERLAEQLGVEPGALVEDALDLGVLVAQGEVVGLLLLEELRPEGGLGGLGLAPERDELARELLRGLLDREALLGVGTGEALLERGDLGVAVCDRAAELGLGLPHRRLALGIGALDPRLEHGDALLALGEVVRRLGAELLHRLARLLARTCERELALAALRLGERRLALMERMSELGVADLRRDLGIAALVDLEHLAAMRALDLRHGATSRASLLTVPSLRHPPDTMARGVSRGC